MKKLMLLSLVSLGVFSLYVPVHAAGFFEGVANTVGNVVEGAADVTADALEGTADLISPDEDRRHRHVRPALVPVDEYYEDSTEPTQGRPSDVIIYDDEI